MSTHMQTNQMTTELQQHKKKLNKSLDIITDINYDLLHPCSMAWGVLSVDEAENAFNNINESLWEEWGNKSYNILFNIEQMDYNLIRYNKL